VFLTISLLTFYEHCAITFELIILLTLKTCFNVQVRGWGGSLSEKNEAVGFMGVNGHSCILG
jgi:hypothetical protein